MKKVRVYDFESREMWYQRRCFAHKKKRKNTHNFGG